MAKKILSFIVVLSFVLGTLPVTVKAAGTGMETTTPTRIQEETLILSNKAAGDDSEGWQWIPSEGGGGTLILENCYIQSSRGLFQFDNMTAEKRDINIVLRGKNILETTSEAYGSLFAANMIEIDGSTWDAANYIIREEGEGSLEIRTDKAITSDMSPYVFAGSSITIESGDIETNLAFCIITDAFSVYGGSLKIHTPSDVEQIDGIYTINGPVNISGGTVDIEVSQCGILVAGIPAQNRGNQTVNISGGDVNIKTGFSCIHIQSDDMGREDAQTLNITGGNVTCNGEVTGLYAKNVNIESVVGSAPVVNVSKGESSGTPSIISRNNKITISGSIVIADGIVGYDSEESRIENSLVFNNGEEGTVYGNVELTGDFSMPEGAVLKLPEDAALTVPKDAVLSGADGAPLQVSGIGTIINNGTVVLPEDSGNDVTEQIKLTGEGTIQKGDKIYTNNNEQLYKVIITQPKGGTDILGYYKAGDTVKLDPEEAVEGSRFTGWTITPAAIEVTDNQFTMPEEEVTVESVYERIDAPLPSDTPLPPEGTPEPTKRPVSTGRPGDSVTPPSGILVKKKITITISANLSQGGEVSENLIITEGENVTVKAAANTGYTFVEWIEDGKSVSMDAEYTFKAEKNRTLVAIFKKNIPDSAVPNAIHAANHIKTVASVSLPAGWKWSSEDSIKVIPAGGSVTATAVYTAEDAKDYIKTSSLITITREACEEDQTVLYTREGEYEPGCTTDGLGHTECKLCGDIVKEGIKIPAAGHTEGEAVIRKATINKDGSIISQCIKCNEILSSTVINAIKTVKLSKAKGAYNKKVQYPSVAVKDSEGNLLEQGKDYTVSWAKGMKKVGIYTVKITFTGRYEGTADKTYKIIPKGTSVLKVTAGKKAFTLKWKKQTAQTTGYQIQYSTNKKFTKKTTKEVTVKTNKTVSKTIKSGKTDKKYYVRVRTYKNVIVDGKIVKVFSGWSKVKNVKTGK